VKRRHRRPGGFRAALSLPAAACAFLFLGASPGGADTGLHHGVVWYTEAPDPVAALAASRYEVGVTGTDFPRNKVAIKGMNPDFRWFVYNSGTDNYVPPRSSGEHELLAARAAALGADIEDAYLHYADDTRLVLRGDTVFVPGWNAGAAADPARSRVPVYDPTLIRRAANFSTPAAARVHKEVFIEQAFGAPFEGSAVCPDGIFLDNCAFKLFNFGQILDGGHIREAPGRPSIASPEFQDWHWKQNLGPFLTALRDTLETAAAWGPDGKRKYLMINVAGVWDDSYVSMRAADVLFLEFQYSPVRNFGPGAVDEAFRRDSLAAAAGMRCFYAATLARSHEGRTLDYADALVGNLAWYLVTRTENTLFYEFANATPHVAGWDTLTWRGIIDVAGDQLGRAQGGPFSLAEGTDPAGNPYVIKARRYEGGLAVVRNRGEWNQGIGPETAVTVPLPRPLAPVSASGTIGDPVDEVTLHNGDGAVFLGDASD
jgi:hypothetical protein